MIKSQSKLIKITFHLVIFVVNFFLFTVYLPVTLLANSDNIYLKRITVKGNRITKTSYILDLIDIQEGKSYELDRLMDLMSHAKERLMSSGLFESVFFNDQLDENNNLILTVKVREKNYLHFSPSGYIFIKDNVFSDIGVYIDYTNMFGMGNTLQLNIPLYENKGMSLLYKNSPFSVISSSITFEYKIENSSDEYIKFSPEIIYNINRYISTGIILLFNHYDFSTFLLSPILQYKYTLNSEKYTGGDIVIKPSIFFGINENFSYLYGFSIGFEYLRNMLLQMRYNLKACFEYEDGRVPENLKISNDISGYPDGYIYGNKKLKISSALTMPLPWNPDISISAFVESEVIGYNSFNFIFGGGAGVYWYTRFTNPLAVELSIGKGIKINFNKKI